jgi:DNA-binding GntR family transcriptional regulator
VVTLVFEQILAAVHAGGLLPGQRISDAALAEQFGVSRTPVREALQRLREIGIIEASASRFTRVAVVTPLQTAHALVVWVALYDALLTEVIPIASAGALSAMQADHFEFLAAVEALDGDRIATSSFSFFNRLPPESHNPTLQRAIASVVHIIRLGSVSLPDYLDFALLRSAHELLISAVREQNLDLAHESIAALRRLEIPQN